MDSRCVCARMCVYACVGVACTLCISCYIAIGDFDSLKFILFFLFFISPPGLQNCDKRKRMLRDQTGGVLVVELSLRSKLIAQ